MEHESLEITDNTITGLHQEFNAVEFCFYGYEHNRTLYFLSFWCGWVFGPVLMAVIPFKLLKFGVFRGKKFKFIQWSFK